MPEDKEKAVEKKEELNPSALPGPDELSDVDVEKVAGGYRPKQDGATEQFG